MTDSNHITYEATTTITDMIGAKQKKHHTSKRKQLVWKEKTENEIKQMRAHLSYLCQIEQGKKVKEKKKKKWNRELKIFSQDDVPAAKEVL